MTEDELEAAFADQPGRARSLLMLPGPDEDIDPEGRIVIDGRDETWSVFQFTHGIRERREFDTFDFTHRHSVLRDSGA